MTALNMRTENDLQRAVAKVLDASGLVWQHTPNGGNRSARTGALMKAMGAKPGVPDVLIYNAFPDPGTDESDRDLNEVRGYWINGLAIELKVGKNKPSPSQEEWAVKLRGCGWRVETLRSVDEVLTVLRQCYTERFPI
jgi:hypothetical protein